MLDMYVTILETKNGFAYETAIKKIQFRKLGDMQTAIEYCDDAIAEHIKKSVEGSVWAKCGEVISQLLTSFMEKPDTTHAALPAPDGKIVVICVKTGEDCIKAGNRGY